MDLDGEVDGGRGREGKLVRCPCPRLVKAWRVFALVPIREKAGCRRRWIGIGPDNEPFENSFEISLFGIGKVSGRCPFAEPDFVSSAKSSAVCGPASVGMVTYLIGR